MTDAILVRKVPAPLGAPVSCMLAPVDDHAAATLAALPAAEDIPIRIARERSSRMHRLFWGILRHVAEASQFETAERLLLALKIRMGHYDLCRLPNGKMVPAPRSIAFEKMPQDEFRDFFDKAVHLICSEVIPGTDRADLIHEVEAMLGLPPLPQDHSASSGNSSARDVMSDPAPEHPAETLVTPPQQDEFPHAPRLEFKQGMAARERADAFLLLVDLMATDEELSVFHNRNAANLVELSKDAPREFAEVDAAFRARHIALKGKK